MIKSLELPAIWRERLAGYSLVPEPGGESGTDVLRLRHATQPALMAKVDDAGPFCRIGAEAERLAWLAATGIACPAVLGSAAHDGREWLLMTALDGQNGAMEVVGPERVVVSFADALRRLHALDVATCPFDMRLRVRLADAARRLAAGSIRWTFDPEIAAGHSAGTLLAMLERTARPEVDLVVTHGDACLENIVLDDAGAFTGFVDVGRLGVAEREQDLALASRSVVSCLGKEWLDTFWRAYGRAPSDPAHAAYYHRLEELG